MNAQKIITIVIGAVIALGGLAVTISFLSNVPLEKSSTEIVFSSSTGGESRTVAENSSLAEKGILQLGDFAIVQFSNDNSAAELISADFNEKTESLDSARLRVNSGSVLAINPLFGSEITILDDRIVAVDRGGSLAFEKEVTETDNLTRVRVLSGTAEISFVDREGSASFAGVLLTGEQIEFDDADIAAIFAAGDETAQIAQWQAKIGKFSSNFANDSRLVGQILDKLPNGKMSSFSSFVKEYLIFNPEKKADFYAQQLAGALAETANGDASELGDLLATSNATKRAMLQSAAARALPFARLIIPESFTPALKTKIIRLADVEKQLANFAGVAALSTTEDLNRDLSFILDDPENPQLTKNFLTWAQSGIEAADGSSAKYLLAILKIDPKNTTAEWIDAWSMINRARIVDDLDLAKAISDQLELTDKLIQVGREKLAGNTLKVLVDLLDRAKMVFDENSLEMISATGNEFLNRARFLASLQGESEFEEEAYNIWLAEQKRNNEENDETPPELEPIAPVDDSDRVARPESELTKFLNSDIPESETQAAEEALLENSENPESTETEIAEPAE